MTSTEREETKSGRPALVSVWKLS